MTFRTRFSFLFAAALLALGWMAGVAQEPTDTETISVELSIPVCAVDLAYHSGSLGEWQWDGATWVFTGPDNGAVWLTVTLDPLPPVGCGINIAFTGLTGPGGSIAPDDFVAYSEYSSTSENPFGWSHLGIKQPSFRFAYSIESISSPNLTAGTYSGQVKIEVANAV